MNIHIRTVQPQDHDQITHLWQTIFDYPTAHNDPARALQNKTSFQPDLLFVAEKENVILGTVMAGYDGHRGWIYSLAVAPQYRKQGVGRSLVQYAEQALIALGCPKINLQVRGDNAEVIAFYKKLGYDEEDRISMGKAL